MKKPDPSPPAFAAPAASLAPREEAVILMAKAPVPGAVKTRLCPPLSPEAAAELFSGMLSDTALEIAGVRSAALYLAYWPRGAEAAFSSPDFAAFDRVAQRGATLGERIAGAASDAFRRGHRRVVVVGADCPALSAARVRAAFRELRDGASVVFGPSRDGGFYLVGLSRPAAGIFRGVPWGGPGVLAAVVSNVRQAGLPYSLLEVESDVDTPEDLAALRAWLRAHRSPPCSAVRAWVRRAAGAALSARASGTAGRNSARTRGPRSRCGSLPT